MTISVGVASCGRTIETNRDLVGKADAALYRAKRSGKNRISVAADGEEG
jgi:diguanylate cyclase (GGDEF)-like protein